MNGTNTAALMFPHYKVFSLYSVIIVSRISCYHNAEWVKVFFFSVSGKRNEKGRIYDKTYLCV
jgi:hypothetical protein